MYFLREGRIHVWLAEGGALDVIPVADDGNSANNVAVLAYRVTADQRFIVYGTDAGELYLFDRVSREHKFIPTSGRLIEALAEPPGMDFDVTADGRYLVYIAWGVQSALPGTPGAVAAEFPYGTILAIDLTNVRQTQRELGFCNSSADAKCTGLALAPDGSYVAYEDGAGLWLSALEVPDPHLVLPYTNGANWRLSSWSPNSRWLILETQSAQGTALALFNIAAEQLLPVDVPCAQQCRIELSWGEQSIWVTADTPEYGCLYEIQPVIGEPVLAITQEKCLIGPWGLHPTSPQALPDGWVAFVHRGCGTGCQGPAPGLYRLGPDEVTQPIALLNEAEGSALWTADASAFLYFDPQGIPTHLGAVDGATFTSGFWDVRHILEGAHAFHWSKVVIQQ